MPNYNQTLQTNNSSLEEIITKLNNMPDAGSGADTSDATATAEDILLGKSAYIADGKTTGTFTIEEELVGQEDLISSITTALKGKAAGGSGITIQTANVTLDNTVGLDGKDIFGTWVDNGYINSGRINVEYQESIIKQAVVGSCILVDLSFYHSSYGDCTMIDVIDSWGCFLVNGDCTIKFIKEV